MPERTRKAYQDHYKEKLHKQNQKIKTMKAVTIRQLEEEQEEQESPQEQKQEPTDREWHRYSHGYHSSNPYPTCIVPVPVTPWVYLSKQVQKCPKQPINEGDIPNFDEFCEIGYISLSFGPKNMFLNLFKS